MLKNEVQIGYSDGAVRVIMQHLSLAIAGDVPDEEGPIVLLDWLKSRYGDIHRWDAERECKESKMTGIEATTTWLSSTPLLPWSSILRERLTLILISILF